MTDDQIRAAFEKAWPGIDKDHTPVGWVATEVVKELAFIAFKAGIGVGIEGVNEYLLARRKTIEASIGTEKLAGNKWKEECERTAMAEIEAMQIRFSR